MVPAFIERISMKTSLLRLRLDMASSKTTINQTTQKKSGKEHDDGHRSDRRSGVGNGVFVRKHMAGRAATPSQGILGRLQAHRPSTTGIDLNFTEST